LSDKNFHWDALNIPKTLEQVKPLKSGLNFPPSFKKSVRGKGPGPSFFLAPVNAREWQIIPSLTDPNGPKALKKRIPDEIVRSEQNGREKISGRSKSNY
jgi:hypothetical protein